MSAHRRRGRVACSTAHRVWHIHPVASLMHQRVPLLRRPLPQPGRHQRWQFQSCQVCGASRTGFNDTPRGHFCYAGTHILGTVYRRHAFKAHAHSTEVASWGTAFIVLADLPMSGRQQGSSNAFTGSGLDLLPVHNQGDGGSALDLADPLCFQTNSRGIVNSLPRPTG